MEVLYRDTGRTYYANAQVYTTAFEYILIHQLCSLLSFFVIVVICSSEGAGSKLQDFLEMMNCVKARVNLP